MYQSINSQTIMPKSKIKVKHKDDDYNFSTEDKLLMYLFQFFFICDNKYRLSDKKIHDFYLESDISNLNLKKLLKIIKSIDIAILSINKIMTGWSFSRLQRFEKALLIYGYYYLINMYNINSNVVIWFCIDRAKKYCGDQSYKLINAVLHNITKK